MHPPGQWLDNRAPALCTPTFLNRSRKAPVFVLCSRLGHIVLAPPFPGTSWFDQALIFHQAYQRSLNLPA